MVAWSWETRAAEYCQKLSEYEEPVEVRDTEDWLKRRAVKQADGTWLALTFTASKEFKTQRGAANWLERRGYNLNGNSLAAK